MGQEVSVPQLIENGYADSINITGEYAVMDEHGRDVRFTGSIQQARDFKFKGMRANPGVGYGIFEMRGAWQRMEVPKATGHILEALQTKEFTD
jgi:hypothetical protein